MNAQRGYSSCNYSVLGIKLLFALEERRDNLVEAHCYGKGMTGQFLSRHVAVKQIEGKTFRP